MLTSLTEAKSYTSQAEYLDVMARIAAAIVTNPQGSQDPKYVARVARSYTDALFTELNAAMREHNA